MIRPPGLFLNPVETDATTRALSESTTVSNGQRDMPASSVQSVQDRGSTFRLESMAPSDAEPQQQEATPARLLASWMIGREDVAVYHVLGLTPDHANA